MLVFGLIPNLTANQFSMNFNGHLVLFTTIAQKFGNLYFVIVR